MCTTWTTVCVNRGIFLHHFLQSIDWAWGKPSILLSSLGIPPTQSVAPMVERMSLRAVCYVPFRSTIYLRLRLEARYLIIVQGSLYCSFAYHLLTILLLSLVLSSPITALVSSISTVANWYSAFSNRNDKKQEHSSVTPQRWFLAPRGKQTMMLHYFSLNINNSAHQICLLD